MTNKEAEEMWKNTNVVYYPYVGSLYNESKVKILVLGESHYCGPRKDGLDMNSYNTLTVETITGDYGRIMWQTKNESFWEFPKGASFKANSYINNYRKTANMITGVDIHDCDYTWEQFAFYNYFQRIMGSSATNQSYFKKDRQGYINQARAALFDVLEKLSPDIVVVWGIGDLTNQWLPQEGKISGIIPGTPCFKYEKFTNTVFFPTYHPRTNRMCYKEWEILKKNFPDIDNIAERHHPAYKNILSVKEKTFPKLKGYVCNYSECSLSALLFPYINGKFVKNSPYAHIVEIKYDEDKSPTIRFRIGNEIKEEKKFPSGISDEALANEFLKCAQRMLEYRNFRILGK